MTNNDILRRIRYIFDFSDTQMVEIFALADHSVTTEEVVAWLKKDVDKDFRPCADVEMALFLNGLINQLRGKKEGAQPEPEKVLTNNIVFKKLRIALNLRTEDILEIMASADFRLSKHELSAFFRNPNHKHYRNCGDQVLRNFLHGLQKKHAGSKNDAPESEGDTV